MAFFAWLPLSGAVPATLQFEKEDWQNTSWGFHSIHGSRTTGMVAVSGSGSRLNRLNAQSYRFHVWPEFKASVDLLYIAGEDTTYVIESGSKTVHEAVCACAWEKRDADRTPTCSATAKRILGRTAVRSGLSWRAGQRVIRWRVLDGDESEEVELAPGAGCEVMEQVKTWYGRFRLPSSRWRFAVTSYTPGEPDPALFRVPQK